MTDLDWPNPPLLQNLLLEEPGVLCALVGVASLVLLILGWHWGYRKLIGSASVGFALVGAVYALSLGVTTTREELMNLTRELVANTAPMDWPRLRALLDDELTLHGPDGQLWLESPDVMLELEEAAHRLSIQSQQILALKAVADDSGSGRTLLSLKTTMGFEFGDGPIKTLWMIQWRRADDAPWRAIEIHWLNHPDPNGLKPRYGIWR